MTPLNRRNVLAGFCTIARMAVNAADDRRGVTPEELQLLQTQDKVMALLELEGRGVLVSDLESLPGRWRRFPTVTPLQSAGVAVGRVSQDRNHLPFDPDDIRQIEAYGEAMGRYLQTGQMSPEVSSVRTALLAEVMESIPSMEVVAEHPALAGFAVGSRVPWCGRQGDGWVQRYLESTRDDGAWQVIGRSTVNTKPVLMAHRDLPCIAYDLWGLSDPSVRWEDRGGFNKYQPLLSHFGRPPLAGSRYWNVKPHYRAYVDAVREVAARYPDWELETIGQRGSDPIFALTLGDRRKPLYAISAMLHAEDEWVPSLGMVSLIEHLGREWRKPEWRSFFRHHAVKLFPLQQPAVYESPMFHPKADRPRDVLDRKRLEADNVYAYLQLHQGGQGFVMACGTPVALGERMAAAVRKRGRGVLWRDSRPERFEARMHAAVAPPSWDDAYFIHQFYRLYSERQTMAARIMMYAEFPMIGFMPHRFVQSQRHHASHRSFFTSPTHYTLAQTEQVVNWCVAFLQTPVNGQERPANWKPPAR